MHLAKPRITSNEHETHEAEHGQSVLPEEDSIVPTQPESEEVKEDAPIVSEKEDEAPQPITEAVFSPDPQEDIAVETIVDDTTTQVNKENIPAQELEEDEHLVEPKVDAPVEAPNDDISTSDGVVPAAPTEEVIGGPETLQENAVVV